MNNMRVHKLPTLRLVTGLLRNLHAALSHPAAGGCEFGLCPGDVGDTHWHLATIDEPECHVVGCEYVPGDGAKFDAVGAARRLLAAARDGGYK